MYEMNFHKTAILTFLMSIQLINSIILRRYIIIPYHFPTLLKKKSLSSFKHFVLTGIPQNLILFKPQYSLNMILKSMYS